MRGNDHYEEAKHCDREVQTVLPNPPVFTVAEPREVSPKSRRLEKKVGGRTRSAGDGGDGSILTTMVTSGGVAKTRSRKLIGLNARRRA